MTQHATDADVTRFHQAAIAGDVAVAQEQLKAGVDLDAVDRQRRTAILLAAMNGHHELVRELIDRGSDIDRQDATMLNPFLYGCIHNDIALVRLMLDAGTDLDRLTRFGGVGVHPAAEKGYVELVELLVTTTDINVNHTNWVGWTPLLEAIVLRDGGPDQVEIVRLLLDHGASPHMSDKYGRSPLELAQQLGFDDIAKLLLDAGA
jgi:ankyrin repeat protein